MDENGDETTQKLHFFYDAQSRPAFVEFEGVKYRYIHNLQGDIVGIIDVAGNLMVEYQYGGWGSLVSVSGMMADTLGELNPFFYRGYVYDKSLALYYLQSRYYNCVRSRFINSDTILGMAGTLYAHNLYAYCSNSPVESNDPSGHMATTLVNKALQVPAIGNFVEKIINGVNAFLKAALIVASGLLTAAIAQTKVETRTEEQLQAALLSATDSYVGGRDLNYSTDAYYFAFMLKDEYSKYGYLVYINAPLTKEEAQTALLSQSIVNSLMSAYGFSSNAYGIYTDLQWPAYDLSISTNGTSMPESHFDKSKYPGDYYWHYHAFANSGIHGPHIWFGPGQYKFN